MTNHAREANVICSIDHHLIKTKNVISVHVISMYIYSNLPSNKIFGKRESIEFFTTTKNRNWNRGSSWFQYLHHWRRAQLVIHNKSPYPQYCVHICSICLSSDLSRSLSPLYLFSRCKRHICSIAYMYIAFIVAYLSNRIWIEKWTIQQLDVATDIYPQIWIKSIHLFSIVEMFGVWYECACMYLGVCVCVCVSHHSHLNGRLW